MGTLKGPVRHVDHTHRNEHTNDGIHTPAGDGQQEKCASTDEGSTTPQFEGTIYCIHHHLVEGSADYTEGYVSIFIHVSVSSSRNGNRDWIRGYSIQDTTRTGPGA